MKAALALALLLPCLALAANPHSSATQTWAIQPAQSQVQFSVRKFWIAHVRGTFTHLQGSLRRIDTPLGVDLAEVHAHIDVTNLVTDSPRHTARVLAPEFFDAVRYRHILFASDPFPLDELVAGGPLRGTLLLHGMARSVTFALQPSECPHQPLGCMLRVRGTISRSAFGMDAWRGLVGDEVKLELGIVLRTSQNTSPPDPPPHSGAYGRPISEQGD
ncbi:MAG: YceI family protein [Rhodanobacteraceae bacterium]